MGPCWHETPGHTCYSGLKYIGEGVSCAPNGAADRLAQLGTAGHREEQGLQLCVTGLLVSIRKYDIYKTLLCPELVGLNGLNGVIFFIQQNVCKNHSSNSHFS